MTRKGESIGLKNDEKYRDINKPGSASQGTGFSDPIFLKHTLSIRY